MLIFFNTIGSQPEKLKNHMDFYEIEKPHSWLTKPENSGEVALESLLL